MGLRFFGVLAALGIAGLVIPLAFIFRAPTSSRYPSKTIVVTHEEGTREIIIVTRAKFDSVRNGMSYNEVCRLLDDPGKLTSPKTQKETKTSSHTYRWENPNGSHMTATFQNDKLVQKSQSGLE